MVMQLNQEQPIGFGPWAFGPVVKTAAAIALAFGATTPASAGPCPSSGPRAGIRAADVPVEQPASEDRIHVVLDLGDATFPDGRPEGLDRPNITVEAPYVRLEGPGDAWLAELWNESPSGAWRNARRLAFSVPSAAVEGGEIRATLFLPDTGWRSPTGGASVAEAEGTRHRLIIPVPADPNADRAAVEAVRAAHYRMLADQRLPGAAWFRALADDASGSAAASAGLDSTTVPVRRPERNTRPARPEGELARTLDLYSGGRALSENLRLDVMLEAAETEEEDVALDTIRGIQTNEVDWATIPGPRAGAAESNGGGPTLDPLARAIPHDQHALFCGSFDAFVRLADEFEREGRALVAPSAEPAEDAQTRRRYEAQLALELDGLVRALGGRFIDSVAITGGDLYLRTGSDVALLFESPQPDALVALLHARQDAARSAHADAELHELTSAGALLRGIVTPDRRLSSWVASLEGVVVVANSRPLVLRIAATLRGESPALAELEEYAFFRGRYPRGAEGESGFAFLSDATIRRWCGPRWRIAASRRVRATAWLADYQARALQAELAGEELTYELPGDLPLRDRGTVVWDDGRPRSLDYGTLGFQTPIAELDFERVSGGEARAYEDFRRNYEANWRRFFDPIGLSLTLTEDDLGLDLTVLPLVAGSDYREFTQVVGDEVLEADDGDPHPEALVEFVMAIDTDGRTFQQANGMLGSVFANLGFRPLSWVGDHIAIYADEDPFWSELEDISNVIPSLGEVPIAVAVDVTDPLLLAGFLASLRGFVDSSSPNLVEWVNHEHAGRGYLELRASGFLEGSFFYAALPNRFIVSLERSTLLRAIDRWNDRKSGQSPDPVASGPALERAGNAVLLTVAAGAREHLGRLFGSEMERQVRRKSWAALPILNEWRLRAEAEDAVAFHAEHWDVELYDPAGGAYVWDDTWQTYGSTAVGHPAVPLALEGLPGLAGRLDGAAFALSFEHDGLRARVRLQREPR